jgi:hypothetical protein
LGGTAPERMSFLRLHSSVGCSNGGRRCAHSLKEAAPERGWESNARAAIARSEIVLVLVGRQTHKAQGVLKEIAMARSLGVKIVQVIGYSDRNVTAVPGAGRLYACSWRNLKKLLS